ncbi:MAG: hypothetical protein JNJ59_18985 [Deltaproteobacteria bacterium]|nr:hypothetical protein [Deltaproteobacteria bacterium]
MWSSIVLVLLLGETTSPGDYTVPKCGWWQRDEAGSWLVPRVTPSSGVLLPLRLDRRSLLPYPYDEPRLEPSDIQVVVKDSSGQAHAGQIRWEDAFPDVFAEGFPHERDLWWEPLAPLAPGAYAAEIAVGAPPMREVCAAQGYESWAIAFEDTLAFTVEAEPPPIPRISIDASFQSPSLQPWSFSTARSCPDGNPCAPCEGWPGAFCFGPESSQITRALYGQITLEGFERGPLRSYIFNVRVPGSQGGNGFSYWGTLPGETHVPLRAEMTVTDPTLEFELYAFVTRGRIAFASAKLDLGNPADPPLACPDDSCAACQASEAACGPVLPPWEQPDPDPHMEGDSTRGCQGGDPMSLRLVGLSVWLVAGLARWRSARARAATRASRA